MGQSRTAFHADRLLLLQTGKGGLGGARTPLSLTPSVPRVINGKSNTTNAENAQHELAQRYVHYGIGRNGLPSLSLQSPLIAILGLLALGAGYGVGVLSELGERCSNDPDSSRDGRDDD